MIAMSTDLHFMTIAEASGLIRAGKLSPVELTRAFLARIKALDGQLNAFLPAWCMCGRPLERKGFLLDLAFGTSALMCPAFDAVPA